MPIYPAIALTAGYSIEKIIRDVKIRRFAVVCIMLFSITIAFSYIPYMQSYSERDRMDAALYADRIGLQEVILVTYFPNRQGISESLFPIFDYYYQGNVSYQSNLEEIFKLERLPEGLVLMTDRRVNEIDEQIELKLSLNYKLKKVFDSGVRGVWHPCITRIYQLENYFIMNFDSAERFMIDENNEKANDDINKLIQLGIYENEDKNLSVIFLHPPGNGGAYLRYSNIEIYNNTSLNFGISLLPETWDPKKGDGVIFKILIEQGNYSNIIFSKYLDPKNNISDREVKSYSIDLSQFSGKTVSVVFVTEPGNNSVYDWAIWINPRIK
jgi:hypothetical protein